MGLLQRTDTGDAVARAVGDRAVEVALQCVDPALLGVAARLVTDTGHRDRLGLLRHGLGVGLGARRAAEHLNGDRTAGVGILGVEHALLAGAVGVDRRHVDGVDRLDDQRLHLGEGELLAGGRPAAGRRDSDGCRATDGRRRSGAGHRDHGRRRARACRRPRAAGTGRAEQAERHRGQRDQSGRGLHVSAPGDRLATGAEEVADRYRPNPSGASARRRDTSQSVGRRIAASHGLGMAERYTAELRERPAAKLDGYLTARSGERRGVIGVPAASGDRSRRWGRATRLSRWPSRSSGLRRGRRSGRAGSAPSPATRGSACSMPAHRRRRSRPTS